MVKIEKGDLVKGKYNCPWGAKEGIVLRVKGFPTVKGVIEVKFVGNHLCALVGTEYLKVLKKKFMPKRLLHYFE